MSLAGLHRPARWIFPFYAALVFYLTHRPNTQLPIGGRFDLLVHMVVFGGWTVLITACGFFGPWYSHRNLALSAFVSACYAAFDEALQLYPPLKRVAALDDWGANMLGVAAAALLMLTIAEFFRRRMPAL